MTTTTLLKALTDPTLPVGTMLPVAAASVPRDLRWANWKGPLHNSWREQGAPAPADGCRFGCKVYARRQGCTIRYAVHHSLTYGHSHSPDAR